MLRRRFLEAFFILALRLSPLSPIVAANMLRYSTIVTWLTQLLHDYI
jgi:hypothetical protein